MDLLERDAGKICDLISIGERHAKVYNRIANDLYQFYGLRSAEITLLITYYITERYDRIMSGIGGNNE